MEKLSSILERIKANKDNTEFLPTGFTNLDEQLDGGLLRKELVTLGASTGKGKSYFAGQVALTMATNGFKTAYFSLEISNEMLASRLVGGVADIKPTRVLHGLLTQDEFEDKEKAETEVVAYEDFLSLYDNVYELDEIVAKIKEGGFEFVVIDFIQNVFVKSVSDEYSRLSKVALDLQKLAKETNSCIMVLSQLSNMVAKEGSNLNTLEYKGSGSIATVCDLGFFLLRGDFEEGKTYQDIELVLKKNRRGVSGLRFPLLFKHPGGRIYEKP